MWFDSLRIPLGYQGLTDPRGREDARTSEQGWLPADIDKPMKLYNVLLLSD